MINNNVPKPIVGSISGITPPYFDIKGINPIKNSD